jgi:hypothetical protein
MYSVHANLLLFEILVAQDFSSNSASRQLRYS